MKEKNRRWRIDLNRWEIEYKILFFTIYLYEVFGKKRYIRLFSIPNPEYFIFKEYKVTFSQEDYRHMYPKLFRI